jgi:hypothetical protein
MAVFYWQICRGGSHAMAANNPFHRRYGLIVATGVIGFQPIACRCFDFLVKRLNWNIYRFKESVNRR